jgi:hypothetical protein
MCVVCRQSKNVFDLSPTKIEKYLKLNFYFSLFFRCFPIPVVNRAAVNLFVTGFLSVIL